MPTMSSLTTAPATDEHAGIWRWCRTAALLYVGTCAVRLILNLRHAVPPGMDAGYYPLQTRSLLLHGELTGSTPPLIFWLDAALTRVILMLSDRSLNDAAILATRIIDGVIHPWVAVPILLLGYRWTDGRRSGLVASTACAVIALLSPPVMRMASDFQKNSLGLVWFAFALWAVDTAVRTRRKQWWGAVAGFAALAGLSHIGAFGITCVAMLSAAAGHWLLTGRPNGRPGRRALWSLLWASGATLIFAALIALVAPAWAAHLAVMPRRMLGMLDFRMHPGSLLLSLAACGVMILPLRRIWGNRDEQDFAAAAVAMGCLGSLFVLLLPVLDATWSMRFQLMTPLPAAVLLLYCGTQLVSVSQRATISKWMVRAAIVTGLCGPAFMQGPVMSAAGVGELQTLGQRLEQSKITETTLVVAPHGVEFWVQLMTSADVTSSGIPAGRGGYDHLLVLQPLFGPVGPHDSRPDGRGPGPPRGRGPGAQQRPAGTGGEIAIPADAVLFYDAENFDVFEVL